MEDLRPGTRIGPYTIRDVAGRGAVGIVYLAEHEVLGRKVALKTLSPIYADEGVFRERFSREAQGAAAVRHPNIISVFDAGEHEGLPYLVMTYVEGPDLERVLADRDGRLEPAEAVLICAAVADALDAAGAEGLAHRDVKPANILLEGWEPERYGGPRRRPHVYLTDFGLIKSSAQMTVTRTGQFVGTLLYMSPEQIESKAGPASDQYSLACVLWECLTGSFPFLPTGGSTLSLLTAHLNHPVPRFSTQPGGDWSPALDDVFRTALAKKPQDRFPTCSEFLDAATRELGLGASAPRLAPSPPAAALPDGDASADPVRDEPPSSPQDSAGPAAGGSRGATPPPPLAGAIPMDPPPPGVPAASQAAPGGYRSPDGLPPGFAPRQRSAQPDRSARIIIAVIGVVLVLAAVIIGFLLLGDDDGEQTAVAEGLGDTEAATQDQADEGAVEGSQGADAEAEQADDAAADDAEAAQTDTDQAAVDAEGEDETTEDAPGVPAPAAQGRLAFVADGDIWLSATDGQGAVNVTEGAHPGAAQPAWRPGTGEVVVSTEAGLVLLDPAGGDAQQLTSGAGDTDPAWDPDGAQIVFSIPAGEGVRDLAVLEPGGDPRPLGLPESMAGQVGAVVTQRPTWSPDGTAITFHNAADDLTLWSVDPSGSEPALVQGVSGDAAFHPAYTPDGNLVYSGGQEGARVVYLLDFASATSRVIAAADGTDAKDADPSPCGNWVVYQVDAEDGSSIAISPIAAEDDAAATEAQQVPLPEGLASASDPAWSGQRCPA